MTAYGCKGPEDFPEYRDYCLYRLALAHRYRNKRQEREWLGKIRSLSVRQRTPEVAENGVKSKVLTPLSKLL